MATFAPTDPDSFRRVLFRHIALPLALGVVSSAIFLALVAYLINAMSGVERTDQVITRALAIQRLDLEMESGLRGYMVTGDERYLQPFERATAQLAPERDRLRGMVRGHAEQIDRVDRVTDFQTRWNAFAQELIALKRADPHWQPGERLDQGRRLKDGVRDEFDNFVAAERRMRVQRVQDAERNAAWGVTLFVLFTLSIGGLLAWRGREALLGLSQVFGNALRESEQQAQELAAVAWLREGRARLADRIAGEQALEGVAHAALEVCANYVGSVVGAIYVTEGDGSFVRAAGWGLPAQGAQTAHVLPQNRTLLAEAASQRKTHALAPAPHGYLRVASGLGEGDAQSVLIVPLEHERRVVAVIELGLLRPLQARDAQLLELFGPNLAAAIDSARNRHRLQQALEETQQLNEELQVQQEELRTANEELEEQSRALKESQANLENQQAELEQTNLRLAEQSQQLGEQRDRLRDAQDQLQDRADALERASRYKSEFLANMSHELRTPLNSALILARLLADNSEGNLSGDQVKFAESIYTAGNDLLNLINDILDIAKVEAGKLEIRPEVTPVQALAEGMRTAFEPLARQKGLQLTVRVDPDAPAQLWTDRQRVEQVVKNLLSNAIKFTAQGSVELRVRAGPGGGAAFDVVDTGIGIEASQQDLIFEAFRQADGTVSRRYGGTGLGLSISRDLARLLGGALTLRSVPGEGSTFTLVLPKEWTAPAQEQAPVDADTPSPSRGRVGEGGSFVQPAGPARSAGPPPGLPPEGGGASSSLAPGAGGAGSSLPRWGRVGEGAAPAAMASAAPRPTPSPPAFADDRTEAPHGERTVLVVEDDAAFARILFDLAHEMGFRCLVAPNAAHGMELAVEHAPSAVLLDVRLPDDSGLAVLQRLKDDPRTRHIPVHVLSSEDHTEAALQMGAIGYAVKPTTREQLKSVFDRLESKLSQKVKRVLLVEDDPRQRESVVRLIGEEGVEITAVGQGSDALDALARNVYDCMIIDLSLPDMSGQQLLERMASGESQSFPPVIVYTGRNLDRKEEQQLLKYSRSIIIKGARSPERLLDEVTLFLHQVESSLSSERQKMLRTARSRDRAFEGRRILVVDDDVRNIFALSSALEHKGAQVEAARNGIEALDQLRRNDAFDMVLMDIMMPEMDGYTAMREIRRNPKWGKLPIIAITAKAMRDDQEKCLSAGASDYLAKPIELERLFSLIRVWLPKLERI